MKRFLRATTRSTRRLSTESTENHNHTDMNAIKSDLNGMKADIHGMKSEIKDMNRNMNELYKQNTNSTRLILGGIFGITSAAIGVNQYFENERAKLQRGNVSPTATGPR